MIVANNLSGLTEVYLGNESIAQVYYGSHLVWPQDPLYGLKVLLTNDIEETDSFDCGHKATPYYNTGSTYDDTTILGRSEIYDLEQSLGSQTVTAATIGDCVHTLESGLFAWYNATPYFKHTVGKSIKKVTMSNSVTSLRGGSTFSNCSAMTSCTLSENITSIPDYTFEGCSRLRSIVIPNGVTSIGNSAFYQCSAVSSFTIPNTVTEIGERAFMLCYGHTNINIPNSVTSVGASAFTSNSYATGLTIGSGLSEIKEYTFSNCNSLKSIIVPNNIRKIYEYAFNGCSSASAITIGNRCVEIASRAFNGCSSATTVTMGDKVETIGDYAFNGCTNLQTIKLSESLDTVGNYVWAGCLALTSIEFPDSVYSVGYSLFSTNNYSITSVTFGSGISVIGGGYGLYGCRSFTCKAVVPPRLTNSIAFNDDGNWSIYVPSGSVEDYKSNTYWSRYADHIYPISE